MNYYKEIKDRILDNEAYESVKDYSKEKHRVLTYFEIGRLLNEAGKHYGESIIEKYAQSLTRDFGKKYGKRTLFRMRQFYLLFNGSKWATPEKTSTKSLYYKGDLDQKRTSHNSSLQKVSSLNRRSPEMPYLKGDANQKVSSSSPKSSLQNVPNNLHVSQKVTTPNISTIIIPSFITKLTWTHFIHLITIKNKDERDY